MGRSSEMRSVRISVSCWSVRGGCWRSGRACCGAGGAGVSAGGGLALESCGAPGRCAGAGKGIVCAAACVRDAAGLVVKGMGRDDRGMESVVIVGSRYRGMCARQECLRA